MSIIWITLCLIGILLLIIAFCALVIFLEKKFPSDEYDERQKAAQGRASRLGMITGMIYFMVIITIMIRQVDEPKTVEPYLLVFFGVLLMLTVDHAYCFLSQAALPLSQKPMTAIVCYALGGIVQFLYIWNAMERLPFTWVGHGTAGWIHLLTGIDFLFLSAMHLIQLVRNRREEM